MTRRKPPPPEWLNPTPRGAIGPGHWELYVGPETYWYHHWQWVSEACEEPEATIKRHKKPEGGPT